MGTDHLNYFRDSSGANFMFGGGVGKTQVSSTSKTIRRDTPPP